MSEHNKHACVRSRFSTCLLGLVRKGRERFLPVCRGRGGEKLYVVLDLGLNRGLLLRERSAVSVLEEPLLALRLNLFHLLGWLFFRSRVFRHGKGRYERRGQERTGEERRGGRSGCCETKTSSTSTTSTTAATNSNVSDNPNPNPTEAVCCRTTGGPNPAQNQPNPCCRLPAATQTNPTQQRQRVVSRRLVNVRPTMVGAENIFWEHF